MTAPASRKNGTSATGRSGGDDNQKVRAQYQLVHPYPYSHPTLVKARKFEALYDARDNFGTRKSNSLRPSNFERGDIIAVDFKITRWRMTKNAATSSAPSSPVKAESKSGASSSALAKFAWTSWAVEFELVALSLLYRPPVSPARVTQSNSDW